MSFSLTLQLYSPEFLTSANADSKKNVSFEYSEFSWKFAKQRSIMKSFDWLNASKKFLHTFLRESWNNYCSESFEKLLENVFNSVSFKKFELSKPSTYDDTENWFHR